MALDRAEIQLVISDTGAVQVLEKTQRSTTKLKTAQAELELELKQVEAALRSAQKAYQSAGASEEKFRQEVIANVAALQAERDGLKQALGGLRNYGKQADAAARGSGAARQAAFGLAQGMEDLALTSGDLQFRLRGVANNLPQVVAGLSAAQKSGGGLAAVLSGGGGLILAVSALSALAVTLAPKLEDLFEGAASKAKEAREEVEGLYDELVAFEGTDFELGVVIPDAAAQRENVRGLAALVDETASEIERLQGVIEQGTERRVDPTTGAPFNVYTEEARRAQESVEQLEATLAERQQILDEAEAAQTARTNRLQRRQAVLGAGGAVDAGEFREQQEAAREAERTTEETTKELERLLKERADRLAATQELIADKRIAIIADARARELAALAQEEGEALAQAEGFEEEQTVLKELYAQQRAQIEIKYTREATEAATKFYEAVEELEYERRRLAGETGSALLVEQLQAQEELLISLEEGTEAWRAAYLEREKLANELTKTLREEADQMAADAVRAGNEWLSAQERQLREAERAVEQRVRVWERFSLGALDALEAGFRAEKRFTEAQVDLQRNRLRQQQEALEDSLQRGLISRQEYELERRALIEETAAFEDAVREDNLSKAQKALLTLTGFLKEQAIEQIKIILARAAAKAAESVFEGPIPFPFNLAAAVGAIAAVKGLESLIGGFATGGFAGEPRKAATGYIGRRGAAGGDNVPIVVGAGEAILNRHQQAYVDQALLGMYGFDLRGLFSRERTPHYLTSSADRRALSSLASAPRFAAGGFAPAGAPAGGADVGRLMAEMRSQMRSDNRRLIEAFAQIGNQITHGLGNPHAARRVVSLAKKQAAMVNPRGRRRGREL